MNSKSLLRSSTILFIAILIFSISQIGNAQNYAFKSVNVVDVKQGKIIPNQNILISNGTIQEIGSAKNTKIPRGYETIGAKNKFLIPGMMDGHSHLPGPQGLDMPIEDYLLMQLANGITRLRVMRYEEEHLELSQKIQKGMIVGPSLMLPAPALVVTGDVDYTKAATLFREYKSMGYTHIKYLNGLNPATHKSLCAIANQIDLPFVGHLPNYVGMDNALDAGQNGIEHFNGYVGLLKSDPEKLEKVIIKSRDLKVFNCPTIEWYNVTTPLMEEAMSILPNRPGIEYLPDTLVAEWNTYLEEKLADGSQVTNNPRAEVLKLFKKHGSPLLLSPGDGTYVIPGFSMFQEMSIYKEAGLSNAEILTAATFNGADFFGQTHKFGSINKGLAADLVLLDQNPLENLAALSKIDGVMTSQQWYGREYLDQKLNDILLKKQN